MANSLEGRLDPGMTNLYKRELWLNNELNNLPSKVEGILQTLAGPLERPQPQALEEEPIKESLRDAKSALLNLTGIMRKVDQTAENTSVTTDTTPTADNPPTRAEVKDIVTTNITKLVQKLHEIVLAYPYDPQQRDRVYVSMEIGNQEKDGNFTRLNVHVKIPGDESYHSVRVPLDLIQDTELVAELIKEKSNRESSLSKGTRSTATKAKIVGKPQTTAAIAPETAATQDTDSDGQDDLSYLGPEEREFVEKFRASYQQPSTTRRRGRNN